MTAQEAQQAQTIAEIRNRNAQRGAWIEDCRLSDESSEQARYDCNDLLEIVDSQAQKIAEQAKRIEILEKCYYAAMNRFAFDSEKNRDLWYAAHNDKREFDKDLK